MDDDARIQNLRELAKVHGLQVVEGSGGTWHFLNSSGYSVAEVYGLDEAEAWLDGFTFGLTYKR